MVLSNLFFCGVTYMKKIISLILAVSILSISVFGCYVQASSSGNPGNGKITEKQSKLYDKMFGSGNWYVDDDGVVHGSDDTSTKKYTKLLDNLLAQSLFPAGILGKFSEVLPLLQALYMESKDGNTVLNNWFNQYDNSINIGDDGNVSVGADAMQGFRSALSDQVYSLGCYRILEQNITPADLQDKLNDFCGKMPLTGFFSSDDYNRCFSGFYDHFNSSGECVFTDMYFYFIYSVEDELVLVQPDFDSTIKGRFDFYRYDTKLQDWVFTTLHASRYVDSRTAVPSYGESTNYIPIKYLGTDFYYYGPSLRVFSSLDDVKYYYKCLNDETYQPKVYIYNNYSPSNTTINLNNVNNYDYEKIINNAYNTINNEKNTTIKLSGSISDNDLQLIIKNAIDLAINQTGGGSGGGSGGDGGNSGGGSGGSSGIDYTGILNSILTYCKNISAVVTSSDSRLELLVGIASENKTLISGISTSITDLGTSLGDLGISVKNIEQYLKDISDQIKDLLGDNDSGGESLFDRIIDFLFRTLSNLLADLLGDVIKTIIGDLDGVTGSAKVLAGTAQSKFPTSIPWDIIAIIDIMSADPQCPKFELPFKISRLGIDESITIDLQKAEKVAELSRNMLTVTFLLFLVIQTRKLYGSMTKN